MMEITRLDNVTVHKLVDGYKDGGFDGGVVGYGGKLDIRPPYQREFVYDLPQQRLVIDSILENYPLNSIYWVENEDGRYELLDGQQRILSICRYHTNKFSLNNRYFHSLRERQDDFLKYELLVHVCKGGSVNQKMKWFERINTAGEKLERQELLNAIFHGEWVSDAKRLFSRVGGPAQKISSKYVTANPERQGYLEVALDWYRNRDNKETIEGCMDRVHKAEKADQLWQFYRGVVDWIESCFPPSDTIRPIFKEVNWGEIYYEFHKTHKPNPTAHEKLLSELLESEDVQSGKGAVRYIFSRKDTDLKARKFDKRDIQRAYEKQGKKCAKCKEPFPMEKMEADHKQPWVWNGPSVHENCQLLCKPCHKEKTGMQRQMSSS